MRRLIFNLLLISIACAADAAAQRTTARAEAPLPVLERKAVAPDKGGDGQPYIKITLGVSNYDRFGGLFYRAPQLPPCGENKNASRTWMRVFSAETGAEIYGYCAMLSKSELQEFSFLVERQKMPRGVYVVFEDRDAQKNYESNCVNLGDGKPCQKPAKFAFGDIVFWGKKNTINTKVFSIAKPDLRIIDFRMSPDNNSFTVRVQNACKAAIKNSFLVNLDIHEGMNVNTKVFFGMNKKVQSLDGGFSHDVTFDISALAKGKDIRGKHLINIRLDSEDSVDEENENNNNGGVSSPVQTVFPEAPCKQN